MKLFPVKYRGEIHQVMVDDEDALRIQKVLVSEQPEHDTLGRKNAWRKRTRSLSYVPAWKNRGFRPAIWVDGRLQYLSRWLLGITDRKAIVDHIDQNPLNNQRSNLRSVDRRENAYNSGKMGRVYKDKTSKYRGVSWSESCQRWQAKIVSPDGRQKSSFHKTELAAAHARDRMVLEFLRRNDCLNFSHWSEDKEKL